MLSGTLLVLAITCAMVAVSPAASFSLPRQAGSSGNYQVERTVTISVQYPAAKGATFALYGSACGLSWDSGLAMAAAVGAKDVFTVSFDCSSAAVGTVLQFKPKVDCPQNGPTWSIGGNFELLLRPDATALTVQPFFFSGKGAYAIFDNALYSPQLNNTRPIIVYTPPSYYENTYKTYRNVLLMHDGQNLFNTSTCFGGVCWYCQNTVDELVAEGAMDEVIIVGVYNTGATRIYEYTYSHDPSLLMGGGGDKYLDFLEFTVLPAILSGYRIDVNNLRLGMLGSSLGGLISCYGGWTRPHLFNVVGCMSSSFWWNDSDFNNTILSDFPVPAQPTPVFYLDSGNAGQDDDDVVQTRDARDHFERLGYTINSTLYYYMQPGGQHNEYYWGERFWVPMTDLYPWMPLDL